MEQQIVHNEISEKMFKITNDLNRKISAQLFFIDPACYLLL